VEIGATTTHTEILGLEAIPLLQKAARNVGGWTIRNMGTVGGNFFAPPPAGDLAVALLALDAQVKLASQGRERTIPVAEFYTGFMTNALQPGELLAEIQVPIPKGKTVYIKYGRKHANTPAVVTVAAHVVLSGEQVQAACIALNAVGPHPIRATKAEALLVGSTLDQPTIAAAAAAAAGECEPFTDALASAWYRRKMVNVYVGRALTQIAGREG
jgi:CO/xanthine dehydrogenase FAD-binding subunit